MDLSGIIAISGKPGLYLVVAQSPNSIIVENLESGRRMPAFATNKISSLEDITMYSMEEDVPLGDIVQSLFDKNKGGESLHHKDEVSNLRKELDTVLKDCDHERIYDSDVRKLFQWYNLLQKSGILAKREEEAKAAEEKEKDSKKEEKGEKGSSKKKEASSDTKKKPAKKKTTSSDKTTASKQKKSAETSK